MELTDQPVRNDANAVREIEGVAFILEPDTGMVAVISDEFEVDHRTALDDALSFLGELQEKGIVRV